MKADNQITLKKEYEVINHFKLILILNNPILSFCCINGKVILLIFDEHIETITTKFFAKKRLTVVLVGAIKRKFLG